MHHIQVKLIQHFYKGWHFSKVLYVTMKYVYISINDTVDIINNKKVLLCERKRHTTRHAASIHCADLF